MPRTWSRASLGKAAVFEAVRPLLQAGRGAVPYAEIGARTGLSEGALRVAVHRLRRRYRDLVRAEIARTLADPATADDELSALLAACRAGR